MYKTTGHSPLLAFFLENKPFPPQPIAEYKSQACWFPIGNIITLEILVLYVVVELELLCS